MYSPGAAPRWRPAIYEEAVSEDPDFASGHIMLAWATRNTGGVPDEYMPHAERAIALVDGVTTAEKYFIRGSYERFLGNFQGAVEFYNALLQVDADNPLALGNIGSILSRSTPQFERAVPYQVMQAERHPQDWSANFIAGFALAIWANDPEGAAPYIQRASELQPMLERRFWGMEQRLNFYPLHQRWLEGDLAAVSDGLDRQAEALAAAVAENEWPEIRVNTVAWALGSFYLALGKLTAAEAAFDLITPRVRRLQHKTMVYVARNGDGDVGDAELAGFNRRIPTLAVAVTLRARQGNLAAAHTLVADLDAQWAETSVDNREVLEPYVMIAHRAVALAEGRSEELRTAAYSLGDAVGALRPTGQSLYFRGVQTWAGFWEEHGDLEEARRILEEASREKARSHSWRGPPGGDYFLYFAQSEWMRVYWELAVVDRKLSLLAEARAIEAARGLRRRSIPMTVSTGTSPLS